MNFERSPFFMPWAPRNVRRVRSVSFETLTLQRTASSSILYHLYAQIDKRSNIYTPIVRLFPRRSGRLDTGFALGLSCRDHGLTAPPWRLGNRLPLPCQRF